MGRPGFCFVLFFSRENMIISSSHMHLLFFTRLLLLRFVFCCSFAIYLSYCLFRRLVFRRGKIEFSWPTFRKKRMGRNLVFSLFRCDEGVHTQKKKKLTLFVETILRASASEREDKGGGEYFSCQIHLILLFYSLYFLIVEPFFFFV